MFDIWPTMNKCTAVAKREIFFAWPFGLAAWLGGLIFINRMQTERARDQLYAAAEKIKINKIKLWIFPEGTRRNTGQLHPFKKGAFHVAIHAQLPIVPVVYSSYQTFLDDKNKHFNRGKIIITALPPIPTAGLTKNDLDSLMKTTFDAMNKEYQLTSNEIAEKFKLTQEMKLNNKNVVDNSMQEIETPTVQTKVNTPKTAPSAPAAKLVTNNNNNSNGRLFLLEENSVFNQGFNQYTFMQQHHRSATAPTAN